MITAWSADGKRVVTIEGDPNHQFYVSIPTDNETPSTPLEGRGGVVLSTVQSPSPSNSTSPENSAAALLGSSPLFRRVGE